MSLPIPAIVAAVLILGVPLVANATDTAGEGAAVQFTGRLVAELLDDGRRVRLIEKYTYVDPSGEVWEVPAGTVVDGASIPQFFWGLIGGPFEGKYRKASVMHDYYCDEKTRDWKTVHRMFLDAMLEAGVEQRLAKTMYYAVYFFGPRWETVEAKVVSLKCPEDSNVAGCEPVSSTRLTTVDLPRNMYDASQVETDIKNILKNNPSVEAIESMHPTVVVK
ncbi:DUF1353 domain-containing protein [Mesorhizobium sp.]|uniref:DUF1353 domain-containing protein n=1 Tax=Mesorhizobium sp. TaxID=1871066 RepID=UPI00120FAC83|nr:DUF1353 domain-containing protein [Mesorhizobium sp.]TIT02674.1 MAG: DUF1353 domain-containing protein [Mesorhizobium sp.]